MIQHPLVLIELETQQTMSSTMRVAPLRWGIFSAGEISSDWASSFRAYLSPNEHQLISVAARNKYLAKKFATEHHIPQFHASYEELAKDPEIGHFV